MSSFDHTESPSATEVERAVKNVEEAEYCLCGIPECQGHEDKGGYIEIPRLVHQLLTERED